MLKGGRPKKTYDDNYLRALYKEHEYLSLRQMAEKYNCSVSTIQIRLRLAKQLPDIQTEMKAQEANSLRQLNE